jgi:dTMP kinase
MPNGKKTFGESLGYLDVSDLKGRLIAIEGTDGVGRTTQMELLQQWLEVNGYGVITTGWTRSNLMNKSIELVKKGNMVDRRTFSLLYATDFADRFENQIVPALRSGFVVLTDRYVYTAWARDMVRSQDPRWIRDVLSFGIVPDLVVYLRIDADSLIPRVIESGGMNYWESGMDMALADNIYDSFKKYQKRLIEKYDEIAQQEIFEVVDARRTVQDIHEEIKARVTQLLGRKGAAA